MAIKLISIKKNGYNPNELKIMSEAKNEFVVKLLDDFVDESQFGIVMEYFKVF